MGQNLFKGKLIKAIIIIALFLRFWNLGLPDVANDDGHIAFRALGWTDFVGGGITTPMQWFGTEPWWSDLSFYDHPPVNFLAQHISFGIFGWNTFAMRFPSALAGTLAVVFVYLLLFRHKDERTALLGAGLLAISAYYLFINRHSFMDGLSSFFGLLSVYFFAQYIKDEKRRDIVLWGASIGLALLSKYTAVYLLPAALIYILIWKREIFKRKDFHIALGAMAAVLLPIIIYNTMVFETRGHFDAVLSQMVGMKPDDFEATKNWVVNTSFIRNVQAEWQVLSRGSSLPFFILKIFSLIYIAYLFLKKKGQPLDYILGLNLAMIITMFLFMGPGDRYFAIIEPFIIASTAIFLIAAYDFLKQKNNKYSYVLIAVIAIVMAGEFLFAANTYIAKKPIGNYVGNRTENYGWNQLDKFIQKEIVKRCDIQPIEKMEDMYLNGKDIGGKDVVLYDDRLGWFSWIWYIHKYPTYCKYPFIPLSSLDLANNPDPIGQMKKLGAKRIWFIQGVDKAVCDGAKDTPEFENLATRFASGLEKIGSDTFEIKNSLDKTAFKVYRIKE